MPESLEMRQGISVTCKIGKIFFVLLIFQTYLFISTSNVVWDSTNKL